MKISVNGVEREVEDQLVVSRLLEALELGQSRVAVAVNREVVPRAQHGARVLLAGDRVEIVQAVQGG